jgi:hypothetical protein
LQSGIVVTHAVTVTSSSDWPNVTKTITSIGIKLEALKLQNTVESIYATCHSAALCFDHLPVSYFSHESNDYFPIQHLPVDFYDEDVPYFL